MDSLRLAIQTRIGERMVNMSSMLVETVSINYEDFNESFLTCGTCLCVYDGSEHTPKLLPCSHTVCLHCLTRIAASQTREVGTFRCPICRELITIPRGGVPALPPSFLVNQLLDLMSRQRREVIPKCSVHTNQELLFCETCETVFCTLCTDNSHAGKSPGCTEHTIIPFSIAIKRTSEILLYKANECISKFTQAQETVNSELEKLDAATQRCLESVDTEFSHIIEEVERRKSELYDAIKTAASDKRTVLEEQHSAIDSEKKKVQNECEGLQYQVEIRNMTQKIDILTGQIDAALALNEPKENAFITSEFYHNNALDKLKLALNQFGRIRSSTTLPGLCTVKMEETAIAYLHATAVLETVDYHGNPRNTGGDPISAELCNVQDKQETVNTIIEDLENGSYRIIFRLPKSGQFALKISVFERPIKDYPLIFDVTDHNNPLKVFGSQGSGDENFHQPTTVAIDDEGIVYVVDTGNSRIKVFDEDLEFLRHIKNKGLTGNSCTGIATSRQGLVVVNWRSKSVTEMTTYGDTLTTFCHNNFLEPIDLAVDKNYGHILVADNGHCCIFVFDSEGKLLFQIDRKDSLKLINSVTVGMSGDIFVAGSSIHVFSAKGDFTNEFHPKGKDKGRYGGIAIDREGRLVASYSEKGKNSVIQVLESSDGNLFGEIDSYESKLRRPAGIAIFPESENLVVVDLGNSCIKKYRYW